MSYMPLGMKLDDVVKLDGNWLNTTMRSVSPMGLSFTYKPWWLEARTKGSHGLLIYMSKHWCIPIRSSAGTWKFEQDTDVDIYWSRIRNAIDTNRITRIDFQGNIFAET